MPYVFKGFDKSKVTFEDTVVHKEQFLTTGSDGLQSIEYVSGAISNSYWESLHTSFYLSGSPIVSASDVWKYKNYAGLGGTSLHLDNPFRLQYRNKFHNYPSGSIISIPEKYFGESIKRKSFKFTDLSHSSSIDSTIKPIIVDDGNGNLYSTNAYHSQSATTVLSSSDNYVGNIFYESGLVVITETGSWSGSNSNINDVNYSSLTKNNHTVEFKSAKTLNTAEYLIQINSNEFNYTSNYTARCLLSGSTDTGAYAWYANPYLCSDFTSGSFQPYITGIQLYNKRNPAPYDEPVIVAKLPKPIRKSNKISMIIKIRLDR